MTELRVGKRMQYSLSDIERDVLTLVQVLANNSTAISSTAISACSDYSPTEVDQALNSLTAAGLIRQC